MSGPLSSPTFPKIAIIGAGLAGLTAAFRLQQKGFAVAVYEARSRVGGRVFTVNLAGHIAELGAQNICDGGDAAHLLALIKELGLETEEKKSLFSLNFFDQGRLTDINALISSHKFEPEALKRKLQRLAHNTQNMQEVLEAFFEKSSLMYKICAVSLAGYEGAPIEKLSSVYVETLFHLLTGGFSSAHQSHGEKTVYFDAMWVKGGNATLTEKLAEKLELSIHVKHVLQEVERSSQGGYQLSFQNGARILCDILLLTIPCPTFAPISFSDQVIPRERLAAIQSILYGTNAKILVPLAPLQSPIGSYTDGRVVAFPNNDNYVLNLYYTGNYGRFTESMIEEEFQKERGLLEHIYQLKHPGKPVLAQDQAFAHYKGPVGHSWPNDPFAKGSYSCIGAGQEQLFTHTINIGSEQVKSLFAPLNNRLFFAGEHTSILSAVGGTMEAAVESAERAVRLLHNSIQKLALR